VLEARRAQNRAAPRSRDHTIKPRTPIVTKSAAIAKYQRVSTAINMGSPSAGGYGNAVALKRRILVVGAPLEDFVPDGLSGILSEGAAYVYQLRHGKWVQTQKLEPAVDGHVGEEYAGFGWSAGLGGRFAAFGSPFPTDAFQTTLGQTQVYRWDGDQFVFSQEVSRASANALAMNAHHVVAGTDAFVHAPINYVTVIDLEPKASDPDTQEDDQLEDDE
jgi:hypothetical protein